MKNAEPINGIKTGGHDSVSLVTKTIGTASIRLIGINIKYPIFEGNFFSIAIIYSLVKSNFMPPCFNCNVFLSNSISIPPAGKTKVFSSLKVNGNELWPVA